MKDGDGVGEVYLFNELDPRSAILTAKEIAVLVQGGSLIDVTTYDERCQRAASYDIRIGKRAVVGGQGQTLDLSQQPLVLHPGCYAGVVSHERLKLPTKILAQIGGKRKLAYDGLILLTGAVVDPGYEGHLLFGLYNASTKKVVLPTATKICSLTFVLLGSEQKPVGADPNLLMGELPNDFVNNMANMDVLPWSEISHEVKHIQRIAKDILDLRQRYENVLEPIKQLTASVTAVTKDVGSLSNNLRSVGDKVDKVDTATLENARQLTEAIAGLKLLTVQVGDVKGITTNHSTEIQSVRSKVEIFRVLFYIIGSIILVILGAWVQANLFSKPACAAPPSSTNIQSVYPAGVVDQKTTPVVTTSGVGTPSKDNVPAAKP